MPALPIPLMMTMRCLHAPTTFNHASNANNITDTSIVLVTFPLVNIRDQHEDEDFIGPDMHANPLPEGFSHVAPGTAVNFSRHVDTALTPPTTKDYTDIPVVMNMTHVEPYDLPPPPNSSWLYYLDSSG
jgi:hypothetical protein